MAKVTIVFEDKEDGSMTGNIEFEPEIKKGGTPTRAQEMGICMTDFLCKMGGGLEKWAGIEA